MAATTQKQLKRTWVYVGGMVRCPDCHQIGPLLMGSLLGYPKESVVEGSAATLRLIGRYFQQQRIKTRTEGGRAKVVVPCTCQRKPAKLFFVEVEPGQVLGPWCSGCVYYHILNTLGGEVHEDFPVYVVPVVEGVRRFEGLVIPDEARPRVEEVAGGHPEPPPY